MSDISVTAANVAAANSNTVKATGTSGAAITAGQGVYLNPSDGKIYPAQADSGHSTHTPNLAGVALDSAPGANQPITYATENDVNFGSILTTGIIYVVSAANAGGIAPSADLASTNYVGVIGVATSSSVLHLSLIPTSAQK
jgi:hypothetical protein